MVRKHSKQYESTDDVEESSSDGSSSFRTSLIELDFVKSALTINPCQSHQSHLYLQGEDRLYVNSADTLVKMFSDRTNKDDLFGDLPASMTTLAEGRQWLVIPVPSTYSATNWPVRVSKLYVCLLLFIITKITYIVKIIWITQY